VSELLEVSAADLAAAVGAAAEAAVAVGAGVIRRVGVDVVDLRRFERQVAVVGERFVAKLLTRAEIAHCAGRVEQLATRVAAKEAAAKALGTGFRGVRWHEIEVVTAPNGAPSLRLAGAAATAATTLGLHSVELSCSHDGTFAVAVVVGESRDATALALDSRREVMDVERDHVR
jgi:holo-[acyl-carrier protein] synthase